MKRKKLVIGLFLVLLFTFLSPAKISFSSNGDLELYDVDPVQVVWNQPALIVNKPTAIRVMVYSSFSSRVWAEINVTYDYGRQSYLETGPEGVGVPINPGYNWVWIPGGPVYPASDYPYPWIPSGSPPWLFWTKTGTDDMIKAEIDPLRRITESNEGNNVLTYPAVEVKLSRTLRILLAPLAHYYSDIRISRSDIDKNMALLKETLPLADNLLIWAIRDQVRGHASHYEFGMEDSLYEEIVQDLSVEARVLGYDRLAVLYEWGVIGGCAIGMLRLPEDRIPVVVSTCGLNYGEDLLVHEIGHTFYLWHPFDIGPPVYDAVRYRPVHRDYERYVDTFMDYETHDPWIDPGRFYSDSKEWIDRGETGTWRWNLWDQLTVDSIRVPTIVASGWIFGGGGAVFNRNWYHLSTGVPDLMPQAGAPQQGNFTITLLNENRYVLSQMAFNASFTYYIVPQNHTLIEKKTNRIPFTFNIPYVNGTKFVQIRNSTGFILDEKTLTDNAPNINIISPNGGEELVIGANYTITWVANDLDGDEMHYILSYSCDEGERWIPLASNLNQTEFVWNTTSLLAGDKYLIKVIATDGVNTSEDQSDSTFTFLDEIPPIITNITQDPPADAVEPNQNVTVRADITDVNSGVRNAYLSYRYSENNGASWSPWTNETMNTVMGDTFIGNIPSFPYGTLVQYKIFATDNSNNTATNDNMGQYYVYTVVPEFPSIIAMPILMIFTIFAVALTKKKIVKRRA